MDEQNSTAAPQAQPAYTPAPNLNPIGAPAPDAAAPLPALRPQAGPVAGAVRQWQATVIIILLAAILAVSTASLVTSLLASPGRGMTNAPIFTTDSAGSFGNMTGPGPGASSSGA